LLKQVNCKRQIGLFTAFNQCQHIFAAIQADKKITVLGTFGNPAEAVQPPQVKGEQEFFQLRALDSSKNRHWLSATYQLKISQAGISISGLSERVHICEASARTKKYGLPILGVTLIA